MDPIVGLEGIRADTAMMQTPDGDGRPELVKLHATARSSSARWCATKTSICSATSAARRG
jgi:hypothetical protein